MFAHELLERRGTWALVKVTAALVLFTLLHLVRALLVLVLRVLSGVMARVDGYATRQALTAPTRPVNAFTDTTPFTAPFTASTGTPARAVAARPVMGGAR